LPASLRPNPRSLAIRSPRSFPNWDQSFVIADIPGILPGAAEGVGLGLRFLKHIERTSVLLFLIDLADPAQEDAFETYRALRAELALFSEGLLEKRTAVAFNKIDLPVARQRRGSVLEGSSFDDRSMFFISAVTGKGLGSLARHLFRCVRGSYEERGHM
jgi:GTP-binding protein